jgi:hypothetical protein
VSSVPSISFARAWPSAHSGPQTISVVSAAYRFVGSVAVTNNGQAGSVPIWKATALSVGPSDTDPTHLAGTGLSGKAIPLRRADALF